MSGERFEVEIESLDQEGRGVAHREGKAVFIEGALPGERVVYERHRQKARYEMGRAVSIEREAAMRVVPRCPHAGLHVGACGGCSMQHIDARAQVTLKQRVLEDTLWHVGRVRPEMMLRPIEGPGWRYRHRARMAVRHVEKKGGVLVGFHERASSYVADIRQCEVLPKKVSDLLLPLRDLVSALTLRSRLPQIELAVSVTDRTEVVLVFRVLQPPTLEDRRLLREFGAAHAVAIWLQPAGPDSAVPLDSDQAQRLQLRLAEFNITLPFSPTEFTQVNHRVNEVLVSRVVRMLAPQPEDVIADFFCGLGNFTLPLATLGKTVIGFEGSTSLVARARDAAHSNGVADRTQFEARNLFDFTLEDWHALGTRYGSVDKVLIDPPREGALSIAQVLAAVGSDSAKPSRVVYVSCNVATLARDCGIMVGRGGWRFRAAGVVNMFPHTSHVESVAVLETGL
ncbi:MAG TPA: 23S rRNA (uracil(1939)-C(5))-methyltransferase RlmD [Burkholderiaceae bacterium]|nr:23S rRNA (uracil(1939)-C(5))-methyltransferase RlmD [Burkholderiaceae bacterium]